MIETLYEIVSTLLFDNIHIKGKTGGYSKNKSHFCYNVLTADIIRDRIEHPNENILAGIVYGVSS
jgi:hypothetical protein